MSHGMCAGIVKVLVCVGAILGCVTTASATSIAAVEVENLYREADVVAVVAILSGDAEQYPVAVYKAVAKTTFKGLKPGEVFFLGPFWGLKVGMEYLVFLRKGPGVEPKGSASPYGAVPVLYRIMYDGYSLLEMDYACVFEGEGDKCQDGVKLNPSQVIVPKDWKTFPAGEATSVTNYKKWVRKEQMLAYLRLLSGSK